MKTKLFIAFLLISTITFAQAKKRQSIRPKSLMKIHLEIAEIKGESNDTKKSARYVKIDDIKGESNDASTKRTIKIGGTEKPYARSKNETNMNSNKWSANHKMKEDDVKGSNVQRSRGDVMIGDIDVSKKKH
tara:strand:- start:11157 stop:11552 length:396 start_codon:yes stop_codon:yes gene_type:complete